jgi:hypothetical protein
LNFAIFKFIFNVISEDPNITSKLLIFTSLERIIERNKTILFTREYMGRIQELFSFIGSFPIEIGKRLIKVFLPLASFSEEFQVN